MVEVYIWIWPFWTSCNEMFTVVGVGLGYEWSRAEVLLCGIASTFHNITPIPICLRCQDDQWSSISCSDKTFKKTNGLQQSSIWNAKFCILISSFSTQCPFSTKSKFWPRKGQTYVFLWIVRVSPYASFFRVLEKRRSSYAGFFFVTNTENIAKGKTNGLRSYHRILINTSTAQTQPNISISTKSKVKILTKPSFRILTQLCNLN